MKGRNTFSVICIAKRQRMTKRGEIPIFCRVTINSQRAEFSTNIRLKPSQWNDKTNQPFGRDALGRTAATQLLQIQARLLEDYRAGELAGRIPTPRQLIDGYQGVGDSKTLIGMFDEHIARCKELPDDEITPATIERYAICRRHLLQFLQETAAREDIRLTEVDAKFLDDFEYFLRTVRKCAHNTMIKYIKNLRHIIKLAVQYRHITSDPFIGRKMRLQEVEIAYLTKEELQQMQNKTIGIPRMEQVRDRFLFGCFTGLAFVDMEQLSMDHLTTDASGQLWIRKRRQKTKQMCSIPLLPTARELLDKYATAPCRSEGRAFPPLKYQKMNVYLKELADICGIDKRLTTHVARHTFATLTLANKVTMDNVARMMGHANTQITRHYARILDSSILRDMQVVAEWTSKLYLQKKLSRNFV